MTVLKGIDRPLGAAQNRSCMDVNDEAASVAAALIFRQRVLELAKELFPQVSLEVSETVPHEIMADGFRVGLQNMAAKFAQTDMSEEQFRLLVNDHFSFLLSRESVDLSFAEAQARLKPQIMPREYGEKAPLVTLPFGRTVVIGIVLDGERGYSYVRKQDLTRWEKTEKELLDIALVNLEAVSRGMPMQASDGPKAKFIAVQKGDGFDAVRILLPRFRQFVAARLGSPFHFGIPNRDFLICWSVDSPGEFQDFNRGKLRKDFETMSYPLSPGFFLLAGDGTIRED